MLRLHVYVFIDILLPIRIFVAIIHILHYTKGPFDMIFEKSKPSFKTQKLLLNPFDKFDKSVSSN